MSAPTSPPPIPRAARGNLPRLDSPAVLGLFSAALLVWAYPPLLIDTFVAPAFIPIFWAARRLSAKEAAVTGLIASCGLLPTQWWMISALGPIGIAVIAITNLSFGLAAWLLNRCLRGPGDRHVLWLAPTIFVGIEVLRSFTIPPYTGFFAAGAGAVASPSSIALNGVVPVLGVHGLSWILLFAAACSAAFVERGKSQLERVGILALAVAVGALLSASLFRDEASGVQFSRETDLFFIGVQTDAPDLRQFERLTRLASAADRNGMRELGVWPAGVVQYDPASNPGALEIIERTTQAHNIPLIVGYEDVEEGHRVNRAGVFLPGRGEIAQFTQRTPPRFSGMRGGDSVSVVDIGGKRVGIVIGTDINHPEVFRDLVANRAQAVIAIGGEGVTWTETGWTHQLVAATLRAAEARLDVARVTPLGFSAVTRRDGQQMLLRPAEAREGLASALFLRESGTLFTAGGWLFPFVLLFITTGALAWGLLVRTREEPAASGGAP